ncbi:hypothetical protein [Sinomonas sp. RB5]
MASISAQEEAKARGDDDDEDRGAHVAVRLVYYLSILVAGAATLTVLLLASTSPEPPPKPGEPTQADLIRTAEAALFLGIGSTVTFGRAYLLQFVARTHTWRRGSAKLAVLSGLPTLWFTVPFAYINFHGEVGTPEDWLLGGALIVLGLFLPAAMPEQKPDIPYSSLLETIRSWIRRRLTFRRPTSVLPTDATGSGEPVAPEDAHL